MEGPDGRSGWKVRMEAILAVQIYTMSIYWLNNGLRN